MSHAHTRSALPYGIPAATLITANGGTLTPAPLTVRGRHTRLARLRSAAVVAVATPLLLATGIGIASASPLADANPASTRAHMCLVHPDACPTPEPIRPSYLDTDPSVLRHLTFWERLRGFETELLNLV